MKIWAKMEASHDFVELKLQCKHFAFIESSTYWTKMYRTKSCVAWKLLSWKERQLNMSAHYNKLKQIQKTQKPVT